MCQRMAEFRSILEHIKPTRDHLGVRGGLRSDPNIFTIRQHNHNIPLLKSIKDFWGQSIERIKLDVTIRLHC